MRKGIFLLNEWCKHNRLYINWSKTFIMFITNKRSITPSFIQIDSTQVVVVEKFKLLGVQIDSRLNFLSFVEQQRLAINKRLYSIKRLFYLPNEVKLLFFKAFILPCFDYCASLSIYFNKYILQKLNKSYYFCLYKLFNLKFFSLTNCQINKLLKSYGLISFQSRLCYRIFSFIFKIKNLNNSPLELRLQTQLVEKNNCRYNLRSNGTKVVATDRIQTSAGEKIFKNLSAKIINNFLSIFTLNNYKDFLTEFYKNLDNIYEKFSKIQNNLTSDFVYYFFR